MIRNGLGVVLLTMAVASGCDVSDSGSKGPRVHVELSDGQVLVGEFVPAGFHLETRMGLLRIRAVHAGEIRPVEGKDLTQSGSVIRLWLRNGSEFTGKWQHPSVRMIIRAGGATVPLYVPIGKVKRLRFAGKPVWSEEPVYRVQTVTGDDFYADASKSRIRLRSEMCTLCPRLSEIDRLEALDKDCNRWRVRLKSGTCLLVSVFPDGFDFRSPFGPERIALSWDMVERLHRASNQRPDASSPDRTVPRFYSNMGHMDFKNQEALTWSRSG
jgi:hypothetical protein